MATLTDVLRTVSEILVAHADLRPGPNPADPSRAPETTVGRTFVLDLQSAVEREAPGGTRTAYRDPQRSGDPMRIAHDLTVRARFRRETRGPEHYATMETALEAEQKILDALLILANRSGGPLQGAAITYKRTRRTWDATQDHLLIEMLFRLSEEITLGTAS